MPDGTDGTMLGGATVDGKQESALDKVRRTEGSIAAGRELYRMRHGSDAERAQARRRAQDIAQTTQGLR